MRLFHRCAACFVLTSAALMLGGCAAGLPGLDYQRIDTLPENTIAPSPGGTLQFDFWERAGGEEVEPRESRIYMSWPLPVTFNKYYFDVSPDGTEARARAYSMTGLGIPFIYLPLFHSSEYHYYQAGQVEPTGSTTHYSMPFWSRSYTEGQHDYDVMFDSGGIPLLWESGRYAGPSWHVDEYQKELAEWNETTFTRLVWWLGPAWQHSITEAPTEDGLGYEETETRIFVPAKLGGLPGLILWSDYATTTTEPDGSMARRIGHGPVGGYLTWFELHRRGADATPSESNRRYVLGGILWMDAVERDMDGQRVSATHGPLWGFMGWGRSREANNIRIFWIPIKV